MGSLDKDSLRAAVTSGDITAVCVDTNIYEAQNFAFHKGILGEMKSLAAAGIRVLLPDIIEREVTGHLSRKLPDAVSALRKALRTASGLGVISDAAEGALDIADGDYAQHASERLQQHKVAVSAISVQVTEFASLSAVLDQYFDVLPPFEPKKRHEFADALTLNALEVWAEREATQVVVISDDAGWRSYCENSSRVHAGSSLIDLLVAVQVSEPTLLKRAMEFIAGKGLPEIRANLSDKIMGMYIHADASTHHYADSEVVSAEVEDIHVEGLTINDLELVRNDNGELVVRWIVPALVDFEVNVDISVFDSIDRDTVFLGTETVFHEEELHLEALLTFIYDNEEPGVDLEFEDLELADKSIYIDVGEVELNFDPEE